MADEMTGSAGNDIDTLRINIEVDTPKDIASLEKLQEIFSRLASSLSKTSNAIKRFDTGKFEKIAEMAKSFPAVNFSINPKSTRSYTQGKDNTSKRNYEDVWSRIMRNYNIDKLEKGSLLNENRRREIEEEDARRKGTPSLLSKTEMEARNKQDQEFYNTFNNSTGSAKKASQAIEQLNKELEKISKNAKLISSVRTASGKHVDTYGFTTDSGDTGTYKLINGEIDSINRKTAEAAKNARKMHSVWGSVGHVLKYRAISTAINLISKGLSEGIKNVALFDDEFNKTISDIITKSNTLSNQIGASAAELITTLAPLTNQVLGFFTQIADGLTQLFAFLNGEKEYNKAIDNAYDFAKSLKKAYSGIGIDELNILSTTNGSKDSGKMFEKTEISGWDIAGSVAGIAAIAASFLTIKKAINGIKMGNDFSSLLATLKGGNVSKITKATSAIGKFTTAVALAGISFLTSLNAGKEFANIVGGTGEGSIAGSLLSLVGGIASGAGAGAMVGGPIGAVIGAISSLGVGLISFRDEASRIVQDKAIAKYFGTIGISINSAKENLDVFYDKIVGNNTFTDYYNNLGKVTDQYVDSSEKFEEAYKKYSEREELNNDDIEDLAESFRNLANDAKALNELKLSGFEATLQNALGSIPADKIAGMEALFNSASEAIKGMNANVSDAQEEFNALIKDGIQEGEMERISELAQEINENTLSEEKINLYSQMAMLREGVNLGQSKEEIEANVQSLKAQAQEYIKQSQSEFDEWLKMAGALYEMGKISSEEYSAYKFAAKEAQESISNEINAKLAEVLNATANSYIEQLNDTLREKGVDITAAELKNEIQTYGSIWHKNPTLFSMLFLRDSDIEDAIGYGGMVGVSQSIEYLVKEVSGLYDVSEKEQWESILNTQHDKEMAKLEEQKELASSTLSEQRQQTEILRQIAEKESVVVLNDRSIAASAAAGAIKSGVGLNSTYRDRY